MSCGSGWAVLGSVLRWGVGRIVGERYHGDFPLSTFLINISGAFFIGYLLLFGIDSALLREHCAGGGLPAGRGINRSGWLLA